MRLIASRVLFGTPEEADDAVKVIGQTFGIEEAPVLAAMYADKYGGAGRG